MSVASPVLLLALGAAALWLLWWLPRARGSRAAARLDAVPEDWHRHLSADCDLYRRAPPDIRLRTVRLAQQFIRRKRFFGCNGLTVSPLMQQVIAFQACVLICERGLGCYDELASVLVYPGPFIVEQEHIDPAGVVTTGNAVLAGQSIEAMRIVLSWPDVLAAGSASDGYNVVVHECAHFLDHSLDQALSRPAPGIEWHALLESEYHALCDAADRGEPTLIDPYGSEDPAEFFAVATEAFIELPRQLLARHAALYDALARLYKLDPARW